MSSPESTHDEHLLEFIALGTGVVHGADHKGFRAEEIAPEKIADSIMELSVND